MILDAIALGRCSDAELSSLLHKIKIISPTSPRAVEIEAELARRAEIEITPGMVNTADPWLVKLAPGKWVTSTTAELLASAGIAVRDGILAADDVQRALKRLQEAGMIRPNPARTRIEEVR